MASQEKITLNINAKNKAKGILSSVKNQIIGIGAAYLGWKFVTSILGDSVKAAIHTEKVYNDLSASVERHGMVWRNVEKSLRSYTDTMQTATGVSDELIAKGLQAFIDFGADTVGAMDSMNVALDLAAGSNIELTAAVDLLSKASVGYTGTLSRYGIIIDQAIPASERFAEAIKQINQKFGGAAAARMESTAGKLSLLSEGFGDLQEIFGQMILDIAGSEVVIGLLTSLVGALKGLAASSKQAKDSMSLKLDEQHPDVVKYMDAIKGLQAAVSAGDISFGLYALELQTLKKAQSGATLETERLISHQRALQKWLDKTTEATKTLEEATKEKRFKPFISETEVDIADRMNRKMGDLVGTTNMQIKRTVNLGKELLVLGEVGEGAMKDIDMGAKAALEGFETFGQEVTRVMNESLVDSTSAATNQMINSFRLLATESTGFFKQMGVAFVNEFVQRALRGLVMSGLLRIFGALITGGSSEVGNIVGVGFGGGGFGGAPPAPGGGESLEFSINNRQSSIVQDDRNLTGRSLVQFR